MRGLRVVALAGWLALGGCSPASEPPQSPVAAPTPALPSWCTAIEAAAGSLGPFECLALPNVLVTGFFGPAHNPERSDFENACFAGDGEAASRLRLAVRPAASLSFSYRASRKVSTSGALDLGFLGPWAPSLRASSMAGQAVSIEVSLDDAEIRVLPSVAEILGQQFSDGKLADESRRSLESCIDTFCQSDGEQLVYTAKVLAATVSVVAEGESLSADSLAVDAKIAGFAVDRQRSRRGRVVITGKEKLNVAALLEPAAPAFARTQTCQRVAADRARKRALAQLQELGLTTLSGRALSEVPSRTEALRKDVATAELQDAERTGMLSAIEAIEGAARQLALAKPTGAACATRSLIESVLVGGGEVSRVHGVLADVLTPLERRLAELANTHALPCADPIWFRDQDRDGYGDKKTSRRSPTQPPGYVENGLDCYDQNPEAYPGQLRYFTSHRGDGSYDYDCDGKSSKQQAVVNEGCREITTLGIVTRCWADVGWTSSVPDCGQQGKWLQSCEANTLSCTPVQEPKRLQACR